MNIFSEHYKKENILSKIDARIKLTVCLIVLLMVLSYSGEHK